MNEASDLPDTVIAAIRANRKIDAIKRLREARGLGLKEARYAVEAYARAHPDILESAPQFRESGINPLILIVILAILAYLAYVLLA